MTSRLPARKIVGLLLTGFVLALGLLWLLGHERQSTIAIPQPAPPSRAIAGFDSPWRFITPENNLTRRAAQGLATELINKNKGGPAETPEGLMVTLNPAKTLTAMLSSVKQVPHEPFQGVALSDLRILQNNTPAHRRAYFEDVSATLNRTIGSVLDPTTTPEQFAAAFAQDSTLLDKIITQYYAAGSSLDAMPVPASLAPLHKKTIDNFAKTKIVLQGVAAMEVDPMRALLALNVSPAIAAETETLRQEFQTAIQREYRSMTFWEQIVGSNTAHAGFPVIDWVNIGQMLIEVVFETVVHNIKGQLLSQLRGNILEFVQGAQEEAIEHCPPGQTYIGPDGRTLCPRFVLNWEEVLAGTRSVARIQMIREIEDADQIGEAMQRTLFNILDTPTGSLGTDFATLTRNVTLQQCYNITDDLMAQSLCLASPENISGTNFARFTMRLGELESLYQEAKTAELDANLGFLGTRKCEKWAVNPMTGEEETCLRWITTEPGVITQELMTQAKTSQFDEIININTDDLQTALANLANSFITQLIEKGEEGLLGLINRPFIASPPPGAVTIEFSATPDTIIEGESATLEWRANNALRCFFDGDMQNALEPSGTRIVNPIEDTTYRIQCGNRLRQTEKSVTLTVLPVIITFSADPTEIYQGETVTLEWSTENAVSCRASGAWEWTGNEQYPGTSGREEVTPTETSTYALECFNQAGRGLKESVTITVSPLEGEEQPLP